MFLKKDDMALTGQFFISPSVLAVRIICANNSLGDGSDPRASRRCACVLKIQRKTFVQFVVGILYFVHSFLNCPHLMPTNSISIYSNFL